MIRDDNDYKFYVPQDTLKGVLYYLFSKKSKWIEKRNREVIRKKKDWWYESKNNSVKNLNLLFSKLIPYSQEKKEEDENKYKYLKLILKEFKNVNFRNIIDLKINLFINKDDVISLKSKNIEFKTCEKLIVGLGTTHSYETSITLHHIYGIPYIPGSALKGVTRHYCLRELFKETKEKNREQILCFEKIIESDIGKIEKEIEDENKFKQKYKVDGFEPSENIINWFKNNKNNLEKMKEFQNIFGTQDMEGKVIFMDSYPKDFKFKIDIMNPHYSKYYSGETSPVDYLNPVPIFFLVLEDSAFIINLFSRNETLLEKAAEKLEKALTSYGIGAKTSLGYGMFQKVEEKKDSK